MTQRISIDQKLVDRARDAATAIADDIQQHIDAHTTDSTERATLRLLGITGVNEIDVPLVNVVVEHARELLPAGIMRPFVDLMMQTGEGAQDVAEGVARGELALTAAPAERRALVEARATELAREGVARIDAVRERRNELVAQIGEPLRPYVYVIVATGNIHEDVVQAMAAARAGADVIAVIRTTAQSLLDYVPYGATTEGFGGTYATQENFRLMRAALDEVGEELGRYIRLTNYASGLCMPEIATMGAIERLDMMLNDSIYGILFRNINMRRTFVDQYFARLHQRARRHHHQHRRGQLPHHGRRLREGLHRDRLRLHQRSLRPACEPREVADGARACLRDQPGHARPGRLRDRRRPAGSRALPRGPAQVHAAHQVHAGRRLPGPHRRRACSTSRASSPVRTSCCSAC